MNMKAYLLASLVLPTIALIFIVIGISMDIYSGHMVVADEISSGGLTIILLAFSLFVLICFIITFLIVFFLPIFLKSFDAYTKRNFFIAATLVGAISSVIILYLMETSNISKDNGMHTLSFFIAGMCFGFLSAFIYEKFSYALNIC